jgi:hypothetical protein
MKFSETHTLYTTLSSQSWEQVVLDSLLYPETARQQSQQKKEKVLRFREHPLLVYRDAWDHLLFCHFLRVESDKEEAITLLFEVQEKMEELIKTQVIVDQLLKSPIFLMRDEMRSLLLRIVRSRASKMDYDEYKRMNTPAKLELEEEEEDDDFFTADFDSVLRETNCLESDDKELRKKVREEFPLKSFSKKAQFRGFDWQVPPEGSSLQEWKQAFYDLSAFISPLLLRSTENTDIILEQLQKLDDREVPRKMLVVRARLLYTRTRLIEFVERQK